MRNLASIARKAVNAVTSFHCFDGITTRHNDGFLETEEFKRAYARAIRASGWDYEIPYRIHQALWCAKNALKVPGSFVELGTGRGFIMSAVMTLGIDRPTHLFDTFLPSLSGGEPSPVYAEDYDAVADNFREWPNVTLHRGDVRATLTKANIGEVAFLHVDMNCAEPEVFGIRTLWPLLSRGGVLLLDDYAYLGYEPQYKAHNALAKELGYAILSTPTGQGIIIK